MQRNISEITQTIEGTTKILVPSSSLTDKVPPRDPAFFNPRGKLNRDFSILAYSAFANDFDGPKIFLDGMSGIGARALRVGNEIKSIEKIIANDANPKAVEICSKGAALNNVTNLETSNDEICRFFSSYSTKDSRGSIVDIDPFGSPAKYIDCALRATVHGGLVSCTATDLQVLHGLFNTACKRRYHGIPIRTEYANEIAIRLILGCIAVIAARLDITIIPLFVENNQHYYRTYIKILIKPDQEEKIGYICHCNSCGNRVIDYQQKENCNLCNLKMNIAGPLWVGKIFDKNFVNKMLEQVPKFAVDKKCKKTLEKCVLESQMPGTYFTLDEVASMLKDAPLSLESTIKRIQKNEFCASPTSLNPTGFRTDCSIDKILEILS